LDVLAAGDAAEIIKAVADLIWPLLVISMIVLLYVKRHAVGPGIQEILRSRNVGLELPGGFKLNVGKEELPAQQVVDQQRVKTEDLRTQLSALAAQVAELTAGQGTRGEAGTAAVAPPTMTSTSPTPLIRRVLWVDDNPRNNAYEIATLQDRDVVVDTVLSTKDALASLGRGTAYDAVVTDMGRTEYGEDHPKAGLELLERVRDASIDVPVVVYTSPAGVERDRDAAIERGAVGATASPTELLELLAVNYGPRFAQRFERIVAQAIERAGWTLEGQSANAKFDFIARRGQKRVAVEAKAWVEQVTPRKLQRELARLTADQVDFPVLIVTPAELALPAGVELPDRFEVLGFERLEPRLQGV
jgi:CheY-like chemotaxis protein